MFCDKNPEFRCGLTQRIIEGFQIIVADQEDDLVKEFAAVFTISYHPVLNLAYWGSSRTGDKICDIGMSLFQRR